MVCQEDQDQQAQQDQQALQDQQDLMDSKDFQEGLGLQVLSESLTLVLVQEVRQGDIHQMAKEDKSQLHNSLNFLYLNPIIS